jgi:hypothetical protein
MDPCARRNVIDDDGQVGGVGHPEVVLDQPILVGA